MTFTLLSGSVPHRWPARKSCQDLDCVCARYEGGHYIVGPSGHAHAWCRDLSAAKAAQDRMNERPDMYDGKKEEGA